jgi:phosphoserine aminotransferase
MTRVFNFSAGPAALPEPVLRQAAAEMLDWHGSGMSVMEMSHRGKEFMAIHAEAEALLRELLAVPANYKVLFMQGGAIAENAIVPMNLLRGKASADYIDTGEWSQKSIKEAKKYGRSTSPPAPPTAATRASAARRPGSSTPTPPTCTSAATRPSAASSTTGRPTSARAAGGRHVQRHPVAPGRRVALRLIYGGAQKNIGPAGLTIVIVREDLHRPGPALTPSAFDYKQQADNDSMLNTPPTYAIYIAGLVFKWIKAQGGLAAMGRAQPRQGGAAVRLPRQPAASTAARWHRDRRSLMNVPFKLRDDALDAAFLKGARRAAWCSSRATARWAACAPRSTTPCRSKACRRWWPT